MRREIIGVDIERRQLIVTPVTALFGSAVAVLGWPAFYGVLWTAAALSGWLR